MRDRLALRLLKTALDFRQEVETFHRVFHRRIVGKVLNGSDDLTFYLRSFHNKVSLTQVLCVCRQELKNISRQNNGFHILDSIPLTNLEVDGRSSILNVRQGR